jgi:hypothetical protein
VCKACFSSEGAAKHQRMVERYSKEFVRDLQPDSSTFPKTIGELAGVQRGVCVCVHVCVGGAGGILFLNAGELMASPSAAWSFLMGGTAHEARGSLIHLKLRRLIVVRRSKT